MWLRQGTFPTETGRGNLCHSFLSWAMKMKVSEEDTCILYASQLQVLWVKDLEAIRGKCGHFTYMELNDCKVTKDTVFKLDAKQAANPTGSSACCSVTDLDPWCLCEGGQKNPTDVCCIKQLFKGLQENSDNVLPEKIWTKGFGPLLHLRHLDFTEFLENWITPDELHGAILCICLCCFSTFKKKKSPSTPVVKEKSVWLWISRNVFIL